MGHKYAAIAFTDEVKNVQREQKSREGYAGMEQGEDFNYLLSQNEADFIHARDSFYMASVGETGWPYVQHRGGPAGFLRVLDAQTIGFADFSGNRQYISTGNFRNNDRVSLILMDYPNRRRVKILGRVSLVGASDWETLAQLEVDDYRARVERGFLIHIEGFDWNCPQHITPRFSESEIQSLVDPIIEENKTLKSTIKELQAGQAPVIKSLDELGDGPLELVVSGIRQLTPRIRAFELRHPQGLELPKVTAGSHLQLPVIMAGGELSQRHYSICSNPSRRDIYEVAVLREDEGTGGSIAIHEQYHIGQQLNCQTPANHFELHTDDRPAVLIAGGIGITPIKAMAQSLKARNVALTVHYAGRNTNEMAFRDRLQREFGEQITIHSAADNQRLDIKQTLLNAPDEAVFYTCGPMQLISAIQDEADKLGIHPDRIRFESFSAIISDDAKPITVTLAKSNKNIAVRADQSILDAMLDADIPAPYSCKTGDCKTCAVKVLEGTPEHLDSALMDSEKTQQKLMCPCVSRATTENLTLDI